MAARAMIDRDLEHPMAGEPEQVRDEPVEAAETGEIRQTVSAHGAEAARAVLHGVLHHDVANGVADAGGHALEPGVVSIPTPAGHGVPAVQRGQQRPDVAGIVLQVAVHRDDDPAPRATKPGVHRRGEAVVAQKPHEPHARIARAQGAQEGVAAVGAAVVDEDHLGRPAALLRAPRRAPARGKEDSRPRCGRAGRPRDRDLPSGRRVRSNHAHPA